MQEKEKKRKYVEKARKNEWKEKEKSKKASQSLGQRKQIIIELGIEKKKGLVVKSRRELGFILNICHLWHLQGQVLRILKKDKNLNSKQA